MPQRILGIKSCRFAWSIGSSSKGGG